MSGKKANNNHGSCPFKEHKSRLCSGTGARNQFSTCLWVLLRTQHITKCWLSTQHFIFLLIFCLEAPKDGRGPTNFWKEESLAILSAISFPRTPAGPGTQYSPTVCRVEISFKAFWHCHTNGGFVLTACRAFRDSWLSEYVLKYFSGLAFIWISQTQTKMACTSTWRSVARFPREMLSLLPKDCS
jgi:hypothetical protein